MFESTKGESEVLTREARIRLVALENQSRQVGRALYHRLVAQLDPRYGNCVHFSGRPQVTVFVIERLLRAHATQGVEVFGDEPEVVDQAHVTACASARTGASFH